MFENNFVNNTVIKEFSVSEISGKVKELLETNLGYVRVKGEISGLKLASSGHSYFNLKDNFAVLARICWRSASSKIKFALNDGMEVVCMGKITAYAGQSRYQLSIETIEPAGIGAMMQILNERKIKLEKEGLFDNTHKKPLPFMPSKIGVITSITGAVIKDIIHRIADRCPTHIVIWPVTVQGETSANEVSAAIDGFNKLKPEDRPDLIIVARGGGSIEDLWSFNEEVVVRSTFASIIPIISAVGHETDYTLIDLAADVRAPTPTAAAEFAVPVIGDLKYTIGLHCNRLISRVAEIIRYKQQSVSNHDRILKFSISYTNTLQQRLDEIGFRLSESLPNLMKFKTARITQFTLERLNPNKIVSYKLLELTHQSANLVKLVGKTFDNFAHKLNLNTLLLASLDYNNVLKRGFAIIQSDDGRFLPSKAMADVNDNFNIKFFDGEVKVRKI